MLRLKDPLSSLVAAISVERVRACEARTTLKDTEVRGDGEGFSRSFLLHRTYSPSVRVATRAPTTYLRSNLRSPNLTRLPSPHRLTLDTSILLKLCGHTLLCTAHILAGNPPGETSRLILPPPLTINPQHGHDSQLLTTDLQSYLRLYLHKNKPLAPQLPYNYIPLPTLELLLGQSPLHPLSLTFTLLLYLQLSNILVGTDLQS